MDEMTEDGKKVLLRNHLQLVTYYLKEEQGNSEVSSDQGNKMAEGRNDATSCEGIYEDAFSLGDLVKTVKLVEENGRPSPQLLKLMWEILRKVFKLHDKGKAHGHLCPESILISEESSKEKRQEGLLLCAKLRPDSPCLNSSKTGCDVSVWQAPEQCTKDPSRPTLSANIYSLGEIFYYCITGMPSKSKEWETGRKKRDLPLVDCPEAKDLILRSQEEKPELRPKANELLSHPLFWTLEKRVSFLRDTIDRPSDSKYPNLLDELQKLSVGTVTGGEWDKKIDKENIISYILEQQRRPEEEKMHEQNKKSEQKKNSDSKQNKKEACMYNFCSVRDLVQLIRNMRVHYGELPEDVQLSVGTLHEDFDSFFTSRFPNLLIEVYKVVRKFCKEDEYLCRYFSGDAQVAD